MPVPVVGVWKMCMGMACGRMPVGMVMADPRSDGRVVVVKVVPIVMGVVVCMLQLFVCVVMYMLLGEMQPQP